MYKKFGKRTFDFLISLISLIILSPVFFMISLLIIIDSRGGVLYKQKRVGKNLKIFTILKFRTMYKNSDKRGPLYTEKNDKRITKIGKILRFTSLDELPQIINILKGEMSIIGPRPDILPNIITDDFRMRSQISPGVTGLSQVNGRSSLTPEARMHYDLTYLKDMSFSKDLLIFIRTIKVVFQRKNTN